MFLSSETLLLLLLSISSASCATPVSRDTGKLSLKISTRISTTGFANLADKDRARARAFTRISHLNERDANITSLNTMNAAVYCTAEVGVGTPPTYYSLLLDTGSSNTWVGAESQFVATSSSVNTGGIFSVTYGSGWVSGEEWLDMFTLGPDVVVYQQSIGVANFTHNIHGIDGILGLGPVDLTTATVTNAEQVPTVMNNLFAQGTISQEVLGVFLMPASQSSDNGELTFGGYNDAAMTGTVNYAPLTTTFPASEFWGIDQSISYGNTTILSSTAGIVDTGTTLILIATDAFLKYKSLTGATLDVTTGLLTITPTQYASLQTLSFNIGGTPYDLIPNAQIWPRALNNLLGGTSNAIYLVVTDIGYPDGIAFDFINGYAFLERYYSVYDTTSHRFGIAETSYTYADTN